MKLISKTSHLPDVSQITEPGVLPSEMDLPSVNTGEWAQVSSYQRTFESNENMSN
jgi:hypothetical protein